MCGKFTGFTPWRTLTRYADLILGGDDATGDETVLNTPMRLSPIVHLAEDGTRKVTPMRWGWMDPKAPDPLKKPGLMHARGETLDTKPTWKHAFEHGRGVVWATTFNIGEEVAPRKIKQWVCRRADGAPVAIAVLWERWEHPQKGAFHVFVPVTTASPPLVHSKDERFPLLLSTEQDIALWLGETVAPLPEIRALIRTFDGELIVEEDKRAEAPPKPAKPTRDDQPGLF